MRPEVATRIGEREAILARLRDVLITRLHLRREPDELDPDAPLFGSGFGLDSLDAVELVVWLENELGARAADGAELRMQMRTLNTLVDLVIETRGPAERSEAGGGGRGWLAPDAERSEAYPGGPADARG